MNKQDFVSAVAERAGLTKTDAQKAVDAVLGTISDELSTGGTVEFTGFGKWTTQKKEARQGRNPSTGAPITIAASTKAVFTAGKALKDAVNK